MELLDTTDDKGAPTIEARVKVLVMEHLGVEADKVVDAARFEEDLGADSLDKIELVMGFEEHFGLEMEDDYARKLHTVGQVVRYLEDNGAV